MNEKQTRAKYTLEFKQEAVRQVKAGRAASAVAATLGMPKASLTNWVRADAKGQLAVTPEGKATTPTVTPEQAEIARLKAQVARLTMERDIAKKPRRTLRRTCCKVRLDFLDERALADHVDVPGAAGQRQRIFPLGCFYARHQARWRQAAQRRRLAGPHPSHP
jgi:transposase